MLKKKKKKKKKKKLKANQHKISYLNQHFFTYFPCRNRHDLIL